MDEMEDLLKTWGLPMLVPVFVEHGVTLDALKEIFKQNDNAIRELVPQIGYQSLLRKQMKELTEPTKDPNLDQQNNMLLEQESDQNNLQIEEFLIDTEGQLRPLIPNLELDCLSTNSAETQQGMLNSSLDCLSPTTSTSSSAVEILNRKLSVSLQDLNIKIILEENCYGEAVMKFYEKNKYLTPRYQKYLVEVLITHLITNRKEYGYLTNTSWDQLSNKIIELFPLEEKTSYYIPPVRKSDSKFNKSGVARGKLPDKYKNELSLLREAGVLPKMEARAETDSCDETSDIGDDVDDTIIRSKIWLENHAEPLEEIYRHWTQTRQFRKQQLAGNKFTTVASILNEWPILKHNFGYLLIEKDFEIEYPERAANFYTNFNPLFQSALEIKWKNIQNTENEFMVDLLDTDLSEDSRTLIQVYLLCALICNRSPKIKKWKPSISECRDGLILQVKVPDQIEKYVETKRDKAKKHGLTLQPFVIVEAPSITRVLSSYIYIDGIFYKTKSLLQALDICLKAFIVFNANYPPECEHIWYLLQMEIFELETRYDNKIPYILDFIKVIKRSKDRGDI